MIIDLSKKRYNLAQEINSLISSFVKHQNYERERKWEIEVDLSGEFKFYAVKPIGE